ncbi:hypothetical protein OEZ60_02090 [Defluviimonas sp. WL0024]|uniref:Uncharacterized protein n=1 Tax=Albidovulum salinarum TaxID=2984153 RepID=A0ABT2WYN4_9RHOB|nr:hypothetical protein [Defluviimonas sp. WL0024]MCU9846783.1 hypothetical protein [Defluviimonas sp. WL0024]
MKLLVAGITTIASLLFAHASVAEDFQVPVDDSFVEGGLNIQGYGKVYRFMIGILDDKTQIFVCGVGIFPDASSAYGARRITQRAGVTLNGKVILRGLSFFARAPKGADLKKQKATCRGTGVTPPKGKATFGISWPSGAIRF